MILPFIGHVLYILHITLLVAIFFGKLIVECLVGLTLLSERVIIIVVFL